MDPQYVRDQNALQRRRNHIKRPEQYLLTHARRRARDLDLPFNLQETDIVIPKRCPVFGFKIELFHKDRNRCVSLDRIKPELGYVVGNIAVLSFKANRLKSDASLEELQLLTRWLKNVSD